MTNALELERVAVAGRLEPVSMQVATGALHAVVGPNGAGKSTLLGCVLGQEAFTGTVRNHVSGRVAYVPQRLVAPTWPLSVREFVSLHLSHTPVLVHTSAEANGLLERAGCAALANKSLGALSGGELKRVLLAQALWPTPRLLLLDEPEAGLDVTQLGWLERALRGLRDEGTTTLWVTHDADRAQRLATATTRVEVATVTAT